MAERKEALRTLLRRERDGGFCNDAVPGGVQSLRDVDYPSVPAGIFNILRRYPDLDGATRERVLTIIDAVAGGDSLPAGDALWLLHIDIARTPYRATEQWQRDELPVVLAACRPDELMQNRQRFISRFGTAPALLQSIALAFYRLPREEHPTAIALGVKALQGQSIAPGDLDWARRNRVPPLVKANVRSWGERIYHVPGGKFYEATDVAWFPKEGWFYTEEQAEWEGWRRSRR